MNPQEYERLANVFADAARKHQQMAMVPNDAYPKLLDEMVRIIGNFRAAKHGPVFNVRREKKPMHYLVVRNKWPSSDLLGVRVLTIKAGNVGYYPGNGLLCGSVQVILSNGDYMQVLKQGDVGTLTALTGLVSRTAREIADIKHNAAMSAVGEIERELVSELYVFADAPSVWKTTVGENWELETIDLENYMCVLLDFVFNPEGKLEGMGRAV